ncbi:hypothetical protein M885DRAFT_577132 [Pelagophyceae sp. CCMP2097]|nr:hypothetical protein M885DRAFT_577132 [Pelagophyceae sp. CCMP2097]
MATRRDRRGDRADRRVAAAFALNDIDQNITPAGADGCPGAGAAPASATSGSALLAPQLPLRASPAISGAADANRVFVEQRATAVAVKATPTVLQAVFRSDSQMLHVGDNNLYVKESPVGRRAYSRRDNVNVLLGLSSTDFPYVDERVDVLLCALPATELDAVYKARSTDDNAPEHGSLGALVQGLDIVMAGGFVGPRAVGSPTTAKLFGARIDSLLHQLQGMRARQARADLVPHNVERRLDVPPAAGASSAHDTLALDALVGAQSVTGTSPSIIKLIEGGWSKDTGLAALSPEHQLRAIALLASGKSTSNLLFYNLMYSVYGKVERVHKLINKPEDVAAAFAIGITAATVRCMGDLRPGDAWNFTAMLLAASAFEIAEAACRLGIFTGAYEVAITITLEAGVDTTVPDGSVAGENFSKVPTDRAGWAASELSQGRNVPTSNLLTEAQLADFRARTRAVHAAAASKAFAPAGGDARAPRRDASPGSFDGARRSTGGGPAKRSKGAYTTPLCRDFASEKGCHRPYCRFTHATA